MGWVEGDEGRLDEGGGTLSGHRDMTAFEPEIDLYPSKKGFLSAVVSHLTGMVEPI